MASIVEQIVRITVDGEETRAEVVGTLTRCAECKHKYVDDGIEDEWCYWVDTDPPDFCSMGERKETEDE